MFNFLGFTHMCGTTRKTGRFIVKRKTIRKRLSAKFGELKEELRRRWHQPVAEVGKWLKPVVQGYFNYHAVPGNMDSLNSFRSQVIRHWYRALRRWSQRDRMTWENPLPASAVTLTVSGVKDQAGNACRPRPHTSPPGRDRTRSRRW